MGRGRGPATIVALAGILEELDMRPTFLFYVLTKTHSQSCLALEKPRNNVYKQYSRALDSGKKQSQHGEMVDSDTMSSVSSLGKLWHAGHEIRKEKMSLCESHSGD